MACSGNSLEHALFTEEALVNLVLPIAAKYREILDTIRDNQITIIAGETGSGKTTQVPQYLESSGLLEQGCSIGITQPRRVAAIGVAMFVSEQTGRVLGEEVGYQIRHDNMTSEKTTIKFMTEGILLRELLADARLRRYGALILDEVHERNLNQDLIMALVKDILPWRPDLRVVAMSATIDESCFARYFNAPIVMIEGRTHPVDIQYLGDQGHDYVRQTVDTVQVALKKTDGDVLVFMPDYKTIQRTVRGVEERCKGVTVLPLFGNQSPEDQKRIFTRSGRTVIVSTNIAETSITLDGVTAVVDSGRIKQMTYLPESSISTLQVVPHSQAGCEQRTGRAGRTRPGVCYRLFSERDYDARPFFTEPEIRRSSLDQVLLQLKAMGFSDHEIKRFGFMDPPPRIAWREAREQLHLLGALDRRNDLTKDGLFMSKLPLPPMVSRMILTAQRFKCVESGATIAATFSTRPIFVFPKGDEVSAREAHEVFRNSRSDFLSALNAISAWKRVEDQAAFAENHYLHMDALEEIVQTERQIRDLLEANDIEVTNNRGEHRIAMAIASGLLGNLLVLSRSGGYRSRKHQGVHVSPGSTVFGKQRHGFLVASDIVETNRVYARNVQVIQEKWLPELISSVPGDELLNKLLGRSRKDKKRQKKRGNTRMRKRHYRRR